MVTFKIGKGEAGEFFSIHKGGSLPEMTDGVDGD